MSHEDRIFNAAVKLLAHKDITVHRAVGDAILVWTLSVEAAVEYANEMRQSNLVPVHSIDVGEYDYDKYIGGDPEQKI